MATSTRVKTTNKPTLKSQGAGYSTTNSKGVTTYYKSSKDAPGYNDTFQGKGTSSKGNAPISKVNALGAVIPAKMEAETPATIPTLPTVSDPGAINLGVSPDLAKFGFGVDSGKYVYDPKLSESENAVKQSGQDQMSLLMQSIGMQSAPESGADLYSDTYGVSSRQAKRDYEAERRNVADQTSQLNNIVATSQAQQLALEGQGRGQTGAFVGGEQARINREAAIQALPIQAQLASSQANLAEATRHLDNLFKLQKEDADVKWKFQNDLVKSVLGIASQTQQNLLQTKLAEIGDKKKTADQNRLLMFDLAKTAAEYGQSNLITSITGLNPADANFDAQYGALLGKVQKPVVATAPKAPTLQNFGTSDAPNYKQYNYETGTWEDVSGVTQPSTSPNALSIAKDVESIKTITGLTTHRGLNKAVGTNALARWTPFKADTTTGDVSDFIATVDQLTKDLTVDNLATAKERGVTFGALSEAELSLIADSATKINNWRRTNEAGNTTHYETSEKNMTKELDTINNYKRLDAVLKGIPPGDVGIVVMPDGTYWTTNSDGTFTEIN